MSGRYQRLQTIQKFKSAALKVVPVAYDYSDLTGKFDILEKRSARRGGRLREVIVHGAVELCDYSHP